MKKLQIFLSMVAFLSYASCADESINSTNESIKNTNEPIESLDSKLNKINSLETYLNARTDCHFEYEGNQGPEYWETLCNGDWTDCGGAAQSPLDIINDDAVKDENLDPISINFSQSATNIYNNGHTIQFNYDSGSTSTLNGITYNLLQFHFHTGSEHTINGSRYPMEMHLVHQNPDTGDLAVIGFFFETGKENAVLEHFINDLPQHEGNQFVSDFNYSVEDMIISSDDDQIGKYFTYQGSLTTPPCSEIVTWYVVKKSIRASQHQLEEFENIMHENFRPVQDLNGRIVAISDID